MKRRRQDENSGETLPEIVDAGRDIGSLGRLLGLLDLFTPAAPIWSAEAIMRQAQLSRATCYRYIRVLQQAGLIAPVASGQYMLGSRILELDRQIRQCDPLYNASAEPARRLSEKTGLTVLVCALYSDSVMCIRQQRPANTEESAAEYLRTRGEKRSLFGGAASKVIIPYLQPHQLRNLYRRNSREIGRAGLGTDWESFRETLRKIRKAGFCVTYGEINPGVVGVSSAILNRAGAPLGSIGLAFSQSKLKPGDIDRLPPLVIDAANEVMQAISELNPNLDFSARAVG